MAIEIRELVIKATIDSPDKGGASSSGEANESGGQQQLINTCVEKVMEIIQSKSDR